MAMSIGELARRAGCSVPTVRYYEGVGLIPEAARSSNGRRSYGWPDVARLSFVRRAREFGMTIEHVKKLLALDTNSDADCAPAKDIIGRHLAEVRVKRDELSRLERSLGAMLERCERGCCGPTEPCSVLTDIQAA